MARKLNPQGMIHQERYLFANQANYYDKIFDSFKAAAKENKLPCTIQEETFKSGGMFGSKDVLLSVDGGFTPFCVIGATTYGNYLIVTLYVLTEDTFMNKLAGKMSGAGIDNLAYLGKDMINVRDMDAFIICVKATLEDAFSKLSIQEVKSGFLGIK